MNGYFMSVIEDAIKSLKYNKSAFVFTQEQVDYIVKMDEYRNVKVEFVDGIYYLRLD